MFSTGTAGFAFAEGCVTPAFCAALTSQATGVSGAGLKGCSCAWAIKLVRLEGGVGLRFPFLFGEGLGKTGEAMPLISSASAVLDPEGLFFRPGLARLPALALGRLGWDVCRALAPDGDLDFDVAPGR